MNLVQMGLSFDETVAEAAFGGSESWCSPEYTHDAYKAMLDTAAARLHDVPAEVRPLFEQSIESCLQALLQEKRCGTDTVQTGSFMWRSALPVSMDQWADLSFLADAGGVNGCRFKQRRAPRSQTLGIHVPGVGSIVVQAWLKSAEQRCWCEFVPWESSFFRTSHRDVVHLHKLDSHRWDGAVCPAAFAEAGDKVPTVPTVKVNGRQFVIMGASYSREFRDSHGWTFVRHCDWPMQTYSYAELCKLWDAGVLERGDCRGLMAKVQGELCVMAEMVMLYDDKVLP
ncbi:hypothetical protein [Pseudomonas putida]|uniref:Uncharacterized protein n=1 Tax=Pseudomonas putida (strain DOT-T1E) TaxID=1196325 RepID=G0WPG3_PSEPT|nr:hypothetical protein [Pseudomonas putida]AEK25433.1 Hypothetical protein [Pseudomonas putida DOT-T1E]UZM96801.1 hypothetical protein OPZ46_29575 [Pseudomonas putida DOT-T1E]